MKLTQRERLLDLLAIQSKTGRTRQIRAYMHQSLTEAGCTVRRRDHQLYARKGASDAPIPYFVAHSDTVHSIVPDERYAVGAETDGGELVYIAYDPTTLRYRGVGGDDKCGLWMCLEAAHALDNVGVIITVDEEIGAVGARKVRQSDLANAAVLIQGDRRGSSDAVREAMDVTISSLAWQDHVADLITTHGYSWCDWGSITDVAELLDKYISPVSAVNLSAGYHDAHTDYESVRESELENALELALSLAERSAGTAWGHIAQYRPPTTITRFSGGWSDDETRGAITAYGTGHTRSSAYFEIPCEVNGCEAQEAAFDSETEMFLCEEHMSAWEVALAEWRFMNEANLLPHDN